MRSSDRSAAVPLRSVSRDDAAPDRDPQRARRHAVRRGGCRDRQDRGAGRPHRRARRRSRHRRCATIAAITFTEKAAAELRDRVRRALEDGARTTTPVAGTLPACARRARRGRDLHAARVRAAPPHRVPGRGRPPAAHRGPRRDRVAAHVRRALGADSSTSCSTIRRSSPRSLVVLAAGVAARASARASPRSSTTTGTSSTGSADPPSCRRSSSTPGSPSSTDCRRARRTAASPTTSWLERLDELARVRATGCATRSTTPIASSCCAPTKPSFKVGNVGRKSSKNWPDINDRARADRPPGRPSARRMRDRSPRRRDPRRRRALAAVHRRRRRRAAPPPASSSSTISSCSPAPLLRDPEHGPRRGAAARRATSGSSRRVPGHRPDPGRARGAARGRRSRRRRHRPWDEVDGRAGPAVLRRRPEAVDLPVPASRHRHLPRGARDRFADAPAAAHVATSARPDRCWLDQPRVRRAHPAAEPVRSPIPPARGRARRRAPRVRPCAARCRAARRRSRRRRAAASAKPPTSPRRSALRSPSAGRSATAPRRWRPARLGDICILLPARTSLGFLEHALDAAGIPYRAETSSLVYGSREVRDLLGVLRAVDDPDR